jgi:hypothetical protein
MFRGAELLRLLTGVVMLGVLAMAIHRAGDPGMWTWFAPDTRPEARVDSTKTAGHGKTVDTGPNADETRHESKDAPLALDATASSVSAKATKGLDVGEGPMDQDPDEVQEAAMEFQAVTDGTLSLQREEMVPYDRLLRWVETQSFEDLWRRAKADVPFNELYLWPDKHRGELIALNLDVRQVVDAGKNDAGVQLWEVLGKTQKSQAWLYWTVVVDLPKGMPVGAGVFERARFAGYFFKLQGYHAGGAGPKDPVSKAPLLIGRLQWMPAQAQPTEMSDRSAEIVWGLAVAAVHGIGFGLQWLYVKRRPRRPGKGLTDSTATHGATPVDAWLEHCTASEPNKDDRSQNTEEGLLKGDADDAGP